MVVYLFDFSMLSFHTRFKIIYLHPNEYIETNFPVKAVQNRWDDICFEREMELQEEPRLTSGSAGLDHNRSMPVNIQQLGFLKDTKNPVAVRSGNLDNLDTPQVVTTIKATAESAGANTLHGPPEAKKIVTDETFFASLLDTIAKSTDEEKLDVRIEILELIEFILETSEQNYDAPDIVEEGW